jgi:hypothetical protein
MFLCSSTIGILVARHNRNGALEIMLIAGSMVSDSDDIERNFLPLLLLVVDIVTSGRNRAARSGKFADNHDRYCGIGKIRCRPRRRSDRGMRSPYRLPHARHSRSHRCAASNDRALYRTFSSNQGQGHHVRTERLVPAHECDQRHVRPRTEGPGYGQLFAIPARKWQKTARP